MSFMHRINLRGPWHLTAIEGRLEASRKFHAPQSFVDGRASPEWQDASKKNLGLLSFCWQADSDWPIEVIRCNEATIFGEAERWRNEVEREFFVWDSSAGVGRTVLNGILRPFNKIVLVWQRWPSEWESLTGRYTPAPSHPIHFDSWLEIQT
jgi:hypothetical protein